MQVHVSCFPPFCFPETGNIFLSAGSQSHDTQRDTLLKSKRLHIGEK